MTTIAQLPMQNTIFNPRRFRPFARVFLTIKTVLLASLCSVSPYSVGAERGEPLFLSHGFRDIDKSHLFTKIETSGVNRRDANLRKIADLGEAKQDINSENSGQWDHLDRNYLLWRVKLSSKDAAWMDAKFNAMRLPDDATLVISNPKTRKAWVYNAKELRGLNKWRTAAVVGNTLLIEVKLPADQRENFYIALGNSLLGFDFIAPGGTTKSGACNVDAVCEVGPEWIKPDHVRSVAHYTFETNDGGYVCSGALLASKGSPLTPYFLTANHCISSQSEASTMNVYWNYQSPECRVTGTANNGTPLSIEYATHNQYGAQLRATYAPTDFTLVELNALPPSGANTYYAGWQNSFSTNEYSSLNGDIYSIHHPAGHEKRISVVSDGLIERSGYYEDAGIGDTHWRVDDWDIGTTEGGSSGAPLFKNRWIIGQLHGGEAACGNNEPDWYGAFDRSYIGGGTHETQLKWWLQNGEVNGPHPGTSLLVVQKDGYEGP